MTPPFLPVRVDLEIALSLCGSRVLYQLLNFLVLYHLLNFYPKNDGELIYQDHYK